MNAFKNAIVSAENSNIEVFTLSQQTGLLQYSRISEYGLLESLKTSNTFFESLARSSIELLEPAHTIKERLQLQLYEQSQ